jgi:hypothetical protein
MWTRRTLVSFMFLVTFMISAGSASAQSKGVGIRAGVSSEPDQFYIGAHVNVKEIVENFWFRPNAELGLGNHLTLFALNPEFIYNIKIKSRDWTPYIGGGPSFLIGSFDTGTGRYTDTGGGLNFVGGIQQRKGFMAEMKIGTFDSPDFKLGVGWTW